MISVLAKAKRQENRLKFILYSRLSEYKQRGRNLGEQRRQINLRPTRESSEKKCMRAGVISIIGNRENVVRKNMNSSFYQKLIRERCF